MILKPFFFFGIRALFFGENEIAVRVPSLFKLLIKEVSFCMSDTSSTSYNVTNAVFNASVSLPPIGLESFLHLPALQCYSVECRGLLLLCYSHSYHVCHFNSYLIVYS